jgi:isocitrate dehydrogenase (NAD+)
LESHILTNPHSQIRTPDMGGQATNKEFTRAILDSMEKAL